MKVVDFKTAIAQQRQFFNTGKTIPVTFRLEQLNKIKSMIVDHEQEIYLALAKDLRKPQMEGFISEVYLVLDEINLILKKLKKWAAPKKVASPFPLLWPGRSEIHYQPYGCVLIIAPWNYPFLLLMSPLIGAICAGNCVIVKPSEVSPHTQDLIGSLIKQYFPPEYINVFKGGPEETGQLLLEKFDYIFFTGGTQIGKIVMEAAAKNLTPVTLELGGKSPCIVDETADLDFTARRIIWGKFMNAGQTCVAPDYLYVHQSRKDILLQKLQEVIKQFYGEDAATSPSYGRIINKKHFDNLVKLMSISKIVFGGKTNADDLYISPTLIESASWDDPIMQQEIFGPLLPILTYNSLEEVVQVVKQKPKPLALYVFSKKQENAKEILQQISFGGGCINDCLLQLVNNNLPFGGIGTSGIGGYHGRFSFETFSHAKSVYKKTMHIDFNFQYPPYTEKKFSLLKWILKLFS